MERCKKESQKYWILICGILNVVFYLLHDCIGARFYPGYNWMAQAVSDLTVDGEIIDDKAEDIASSTKYEA